MKQLQLEIPGTESLGPLFEQEEIRGLSFWQPFGTLMFHGKVETRKWSTPYRGLVLICTTKAPLEKQPLNKSRHITFSAFDKLRIDATLDFNEKLVGYPPTAHLNGFAIGVGRLTHCRPVWEEDKTFFQHMAIKSFPVFAHIYEDVKRIKPFPVSGNQGWFKVTPDMRAQIQLA